MNAPKAVIMLEQDRVWDMPGFDFDGEPYVESYGLCGHHAEVENMESDD